MSRLVVTLLGLAAIGWVNWYFFVAGQRSSRVSMLDRVSPRDRRERGPKS